MTEYTQLDYKILQRNDPQNLAEDVAEWTSNGWRLKGGVAVFLDKQHRPVFVQAIVR
jgi:hypothetical protein